MHLFIHYVFNSFGAGSQGKISQETGAERSSTLVEDSDGGIDGTGE